MTVPPDYLARNRALALRFLSQRLTRVVRLLGEDEPVDSPRFGPGEAIIDGDHGDRWLVSNDAALANAVLVDALAAPEALRRLGRLYPVEVPIATADPADPLSFLFSDEIVAVEVASRLVPVEPPDAFTMCGIRLIAKGGDTVCFGTHLGTLVQPDIGFYLGEELDPALTFTRLSAP